MIHYVLDRSDPPLVLCRKLLTMRDMLTSVDRRVTCPLCRRLLATGATSP